MSLLPEINQASAEINKFVAQANIHQTIAPVDPAAFTDPADTLLLASRDPVIREVSVGMTGVEAASYTVSGTPPLSLPNSLGKPLKAWSVDLLPYQEGSGDPSPDNVRAIHGTDKVTVWTAGKNLYNSATFQTITRSGVTLTNNGDGSFTLNGTATTDTFFNVFDPQFAPAVGGTPLPSANYYLTGCPSGGSTNTYFLYIIPNYRNDFGSGVSFTGQINGGSIFVKNGYTCDNLVFRPQICLASAPNPTEFAPYVTSSQTVLTLPQTVYTGTIGSEGGESRWGEVDLGTLNWDASTPENHIFRSNSLQGSIVPPVTGNIVTSAICEQFSAMGYTPISASDNGKFAVADITNYASGRIVFIDHRWDSIDDFVTAVSGVKLVFPLINPTTFSVPSVTIPSPSGTATTWATAEDGIVDTMEVTYIGKA